jgi:glycosyltransferase involved in cell wall biosynthesis
LAERRALSKLFRRECPDVVHTHGYRIDLLDRRVAAKLGIPTVTTVHGASKTGGLKGALFEWLQRRNYRRFSAVVAVSDPLFAETLADGVPRDRLHLIRNAWGGQRAPLSREEARHRMGVASDEQVVGWVGRLIPVKGADVLIRAAALLPRPCPTIALVGYGPELQRLRTLAVEQGVGEAVRFYTDIRDAGRYFSAFDTFALTSRSEGLPIVMLEAMAARTPIVATEVGGLPDALRGGAGWLCPPEDPEALALAIHSSLEDRQEAEQRAERGTQRLEKEFSIGSFLDLYEDVYRSVLKSPQLR